MDGGSGFGAKVPATRPAADDTVRIVPHHEDAAVPLDTWRILWQR